MKFSAIVAIVAFVMTAGSAEAASYGYNAAPADTQVAPEYKPEYKAPADTQIKVPDYKAAVVYGKVAPVVADYKDKVEDYVSTKKSTYGGQGKQVDDYVEKLPTYVDDVKYDGKNATMTDYKDNKSSYGNYSGDQKEEKKEEYKEEKKEEYKEKKEEKKENYQDNASKQVDSIMNKAREYADVTNSAARPAAGALAIVALVATLLA